MTDGDGTPDGAARVVPSPGAADRLADPPADLLDRARLLEELEADLRSRLGALDGR